MAKPRRPRTPLRHLIDILWMSPLVALPFAAFFGVLYGAGGGFQTFVATYIVSLVMAFTISAFLWLAEHVLVPLLQRRAPEITGRVPMAEALVYVSASILGSYTAALILRLTIAPHFLGGAREFMMFGAFTLLFTVLFTAVSYAIVYYRKSLERARADQELSLARRIQRSFLLSQFPSMPRLEMHAVNVSSKEVSGDFYDVVPAGDDAILLAVADVSGKGVPAALLTSMLQASLRTQAPTVRSVASILANVNDLVYRSASVSQFATFFLARVEERTLRLAYSNAGHNYPIVYRRGGQRLTLERGGTVIGILEHAAFEEGALELLPGDRVLLYTDGINEAMNAAGEMFGEDRIHAAIEPLPPALPASEIVEALLASVRKFLDGVEPGDDMTVMVVRVLDAATTSPHA